MGVVTQGALTSLWAAALVWAAGAPDVTAAGVRAALTPADAQEEEDKEDSEADNNHEQPVCREMGAGPEPGGLGGNRDTAGQCRDGWAKLSAKLVREAVALAGVSMPEAGARQQRAAQLVCNSGQSQRNSPWTQQGKAEKER